MTDISNDAYLAREAIVEAAAFLQAAHVRMRPRVFPDGAAWCCLYGDNLQEGVAGFGDTPAQACHAFDLAWDAARTPAAALAALNAPTGAVEPTARQRALADMVALDEEIEANHPGWMTGAVEKGEAK